MKSSKILKMSCFFLIFCPRPNLHAFDGKRNELIQMYNERLAILVPENGIDGKIFRMSVNQETVKAPNGAYMLPDRLHLMKKDQQVDNPPTMKANINLILNFMCNNVIKPSDSTCCVW